MPATALPLIIEPLKLVEQRVDLQGVIELNNFKRLQGVILDRSGEAEVFLRFVKDEQGIRTIVGTVSSDVQMQCQRCLQPVKIAVEGKVNLGIVFSEESAKNLPSHYEPLQLDNQHIELASIIEDELILSLPLIALHAETECSIDRQYQPEPENNDQVSPNPFAKLAELKNSD